MVTARAEGTLVPQLYRVTRVQRELADTVSLEVEPLTGPRPSYEPGQFNMLYAFGIGEIAISVSAGAAEGGSFVHTVRNVGAVSAALAGLAEGSKVGLRGPFGRGWPLSAAEGSELVVVAGGLGLAPLRPVIHEALANPAHFRRLFVLFGSRNPGDLLYREEMDVWRQREDVSVELTVDHADADWHGHVGVVPSLIARASFDCARAVALVCGPEVMMRFSVNALLDAGVSPARIYLSMERNMKCAIGLCGHCQFGPAFVCKDGPVMSFDSIAEIFNVREI